MTDLPPASQEESAARRRKMIEHLTEACRLATLEGVPNLLRGPGLVQQLIVSDALGHVPCLSWHDGPGDAYAAADPKQRFEIITAIERRRFQAGAAGKDSHGRLSNRLHAATLVYLAVFDAAEPLKLLRVYAVEPETIWKKVEGVIDDSGSEKAYISLSERWAAEHGRRVIPAATREGGHHRT